MLELVLPLPPSVNHYYRRVGRRTLISREGRAFRRKVCSILSAEAIATVPGRLAVCVELFPPDRRRRDIDNVQKSLLDALEHGGAYRDDGQIDLLIARRCSVVDGGACVVRIGRLPVDRCPLCGGPYAG